MDELADRERLKLDLASSFAKHAKTRFTSAIFIVIAAGIVVGAVLFLLSDSLLMSIIAALVFGLLLLNLAMIFVLPPADRVNASRDLIYEAVCDHTRIKVFEADRVEIADSEGEVVQLAGFEKAIWMALVVPYFIRHVMRVEQGGAMPTATGRKITASERKYIEDLRRKVEQAQKEMDGKSKLLAEREQELAQREQDLDEREEWIRVQVDRGKDGLGE